jgi:hypothetical protein
VGPEPPEDRRRRGFDLVAILAPRPLQLLQDLDESGRPHRLVGGK